MLLFLLIYEQLKYRFHVHWPDCPIYLSITVSGSPDCERLAANLSHKLLDKIKYKRYIILKDSTMEHYIQVCL